MASFMLVVLVSAVAIFHVNASTLYFKQFEDAKDFQQLFSILSKPRVPERFKPESVNQQFYAPKVGAFSWKSCGTKSDLIQLQTLSLQPDPLKIPGNITVSANGAITEDFGMPLVAHLKIEKKMIFWIPIPCMDNIGSCTYDNLCDMLATITTCPTGLPCHCPFKAGTYKLPPTTIDADISGIPSWLTEGDYRVTAHLTSGSKQAACLTLDLTLTN